MKKRKLKKVMQDHKKWLNRIAGGKFADLRDADLRGADLHGADLDCADLRGADLRGAVLHDATLTNTDLRGANIDYTSWPLSCGSLDVKLDDRQKRQLLYHVLAVAPEYRTPELIEEANKFHRIPATPKLKEGEWFQRKQPKIKYSDINIIYDKFLKLVEKTKYELAFRIMDLDDEFEQLKKSRQYYKQLTDRLRYRVYLNVFDLVEDESSRRMFDNFMKENYTHNGNCSSNSHSCLACQKEFILKGGE